MMQEGKKLVELASKNLTAPAQRNFQLGNVGNQQIVQAQVEKTYLVLNEQEFVKEFGAKR